jgi:hypothetical protein
VIVPADIPTLNQSTTGTSAGVAGTVLANRVYASPNGTSGSLSPRLLVAADVPTLNQNTTGSAANWTTGRTLSITGDLAYTSPSFDGSGNVTAAGTLANTITAAGPTGSSSVVPVITYDAKGRLTTVTTATITPAAIGAQPVVTGGTAGAIVKFGASNTLANSSLADVSGTVSTTEPIG